MSGRHRKQQHDDNGNGKNTNNKGGNGRASISPPSSKRKRPAPPPPPPKALVTLLKKNKSVLSYFTSLQENLEADVQKWKDRARHYQSLYEKEQEENTRLKANNKNKQQTYSGETWRRGSSLGEDLKEYENGQDSNAKVMTFGNNPPNIQTGQERPHHEDKRTSFEEAGETIDDTAFEYESSDDESNAEKETDDNPQELPTSVHANNEKAEEEIDNCMLQYLSEDEDSDNNSKDIIANKKQKLSHVPTTVDGYKPDQQTEKEYETAMQSATPFGQKYKSHIVEELIDAYRCLEHIGVELVVRKADDNAERSVDEHGVPATENPEDDDGTPNESSEYQDGVADATDAQKSTESEEENEGIFSFLPSQQDTQTIKRQIATENNNTTQNKQEKDHETTVRFERCTNEDVVVDIMDVLRSLSRIRIQYKDLPDKYEPFRIAPLWIPADDFLNPGDTDAATDSQPDHPITFAKICIIRALYVMDTFCVSNESFRLASRSSSEGFSSEGSWERLFVGLHPGITSAPDLLPAIRVGMCNRKELVDHLLVYLFTEISATWAISDRSARMSGALVYEPDEAAEISNDSKEKLEDGESTSNSLGQSNIHKAASSKSQIRLSSLIERRLQAQIAVHLCLLRKDPQRAFQLVAEYLSSTAPSLDLEDYPKFQPVLSLVVLEGMLRIDNDLLLSGGREQEMNKSSDDSEHNQDLEVRKSWFNQCLHRYRGRLLGKLNDFARRSIVLQIRTTACIWRQRLQSSDARISDIARVELAAYRRLLVSESPWLTDETGIDDDEGLHNSNHLLDRCRIAAGGLIDEFQRDVLSKGGKEESQERGCLIDLNVSTGLHLSTILVGDDELVKEIFSSAKCVLNNDPLGTFTEQSTTAIAHSVIHACSRTLRQIELRKLDKYRQRVGRFVNPGSSEKCAWSACLSALIQVLRATCLGHAWPLAATILDCCCLLSDGESANEVMDLLVQQDTSRSNDHSSDTILSNWEVVKRVSDAVEKTSLVPTVRVINLKRRSDRMDSMRSHALQSGILLVKAVAALEGGDEDNSEKFHYFGGHAIDGGLTKIDEIAAQVLHLTGASQSPRRLLEAYVAPEWRPHDLKPFDRDANPDETFLVRISDTERACALSHISAWKGVLRSLTADSPSTESSLFQDGEGVKRLFRHSGFARGKSLHPENSNMPPSAVCVILEDDAILVDQFVERLDCLLEELPRDFHFCSLGYGRPKTAPLVKFSSQLGIPTCVWYLTGYIISLEGATHLMSSLPVRGPVDSWIGLKMCANWDNRFGEMVGVGTHSKPIEEAPSLKELAKIVAFRAFAARTPLCNQRVGTAFSTAGISERNWRQRDTDITYSGSENYRNN